MHQDRAIEPLKEPRHGRRILGDDAVGVVRPVLTDMRNRAVNVVDDLSRDIHVEVFAAPIVVGRNVSTAQPLACMNANAFVHQRFDQISAQ